MDVKKQTMFLLNIFKSIYEHLQGYVFETIYTCCLEA